jgi:hypothetical protein
MQKGQNSLENEDQAETGAKGKYSPKLQAGKLEDMMKIT